MAPKDIRLPSFKPSTIAQIAREMRNPNIEIGRALPDSKGAETPKSLQTYRTDVRTVFTTPSATHSELVYRAENWIHFRARLQTAGPVAIGTVGEITPVLSGQGILMDPDQPFDVVLAKGAQVYIASETINRVDIIVEPIPWIEQLDIDMVETQHQLLQAVLSIGNQITAALAALQAREPVATATPAKPAIPTLPRGVMPFKKIPGRR